MWHWRPDPGAAAQGITIPQTFDHQADAESWLTAHYEELQDEGVATVTLCEGDRVVYGPMSLSPT